MDLIIPTTEEDDGKPAEGKAASGSLGYWAAGFEWALANFPQLEEGPARRADLPDSIWRHLPNNEDETQREMTKALDQEHSAQT